MVIYFEFLVFVGLMVFFHDFSGFVECLLILMCFIWRCKGYIYECGVVCFC